MSGHLVLLKQSSSQVHSGSGNQKKSKKAAAASSTSSGSATTASRWFSLRPDFVLYSFRDRDARRALTATPVPGCLVESGAEDPAAAAAALPASAGVDERERVVKMSFRNNHLLLPRLPPSGPMSAAAAPEPDPALGREYYFLADSIQEARR